jgi:OmpA-OmpF porin, OOP family
MMNIRRLFAVALFSCVGMTTFAQSTCSESCNKDYKPYPYWFIGLQGGGQVTFTNYKVTDLITPVGAVSFGRFFAPAVGARIHVSGYMNKGGFSSLNQTYDYKYITSDLDLMLNLTNLFGKKCYHPFNVILIGGFGLNYAWDNDDVNNMVAANPSLNAPLAWKDDRMSHNLRAGLMFDYSFAKHWSLNLEVDANSLSDRYNSKTNDRDDWQCDALLGLAYKFGFQKAEKPAPAPEVWATRTDTVWYDDVSYKTIPAEDSIARNIYYNIKIVDPSPQAMINEVAEFVKNHKDCKVTVTGYADKGTGNPKINMGYSKGRAENVSKALVDAGVPASIITTSWKGDTVQPFAENDKNRVAITVANGTGEKQEKVITKKFRLEEVRYKVQ